MDIKEIISGATKLAIGHYGDNTTQKFYGFLKERKFMSTKCKKCDKVFFPPRKFCPHCFGEDVEWVELPKEGKIFSFTTQDRSLRFPAPDVIGFVELEGVGRILTKIDGKMEELKIGQRVKLDFTEIEGGYVLHKFVPID